MTAGLPACLGSMPYRPICSLSMRYMRDDNMSTSDRDVRTNSVSTDEETFIVV